ncbi:hypothetical protein XM38_005690 [Halomicronema hongdechloris C2206]|uniref:Chlororespiratory reduction protein 7 n=1 Tax=Halomicronema hongdechloris C2206 TaxID=1641165 RepID=A0A1Z3HH87_9CYAN|nr:chlororespiratory reduction protein 7 [Halomicronema hongdechloris]ASC69640.1 hypothetical protein XM38_005690 [Halomicronema hongdechloris C2206]
MLEMTLYGIAMPDAIMYRDDDMYVLLIPGQDEVFLTPDELLERLKGVLADCQEALPRELRALENLDAQARHLRDTACEFERQPGERWQWYVVRLEK